MNQTKKIDELYQAALERADPRAQTRFFRALRQRLYVLVAQEMRRARFQLSAADVDDLVQELLIDAWRIDLGRYDPRRGSLLAFLRRKVRWRLIELVRRVARRRSQALGEALVDEADPESTLSARRERGAREQLEARALAALPSLEPRAREAIERYDLGSDELKRVARDHRVHPSSITRARQRGLDQLRATLTCDSPPSCTRSSSSASRRKPRPTRAVRRR